MVFWRSRCGSRRSPIELLAFAVIRVCGNTFAFAVNSIRRHESNCKGDNDAGEDSVIGEVLECDVVIEEGGVPDEI